MSHGMQLNHSLLHLFWILISSGSRSNYAVVSKVTEGMGFLSNWSKYSGMLTPKPYDICIMLYPSIMFFSKLASLQVYTPYISKGQKKRATT